MTIHSNRTCALVLAGCGAKDGAEITESVSLMIALAQENFKVKIFAPNRNFYHVVNHLKDEVVTQESRNMLVEGARIARGQIAALNTLSVQDFDVLCFAGGFGVAKNLCNFAFAGKDAVLSEDVKHVLFAFIKAQKSVGALCISPILLALAAKELQLKNVKLTFGSSDCDPAKIIESWGMQHEEKAVGEACLDAAHKFVSAPAYMYDQATPADIFNSAKSLVKLLVS